MAVLPNAPWKQPPAGHARCGGQPRLPRTLGSASPAGPGQDEEPVLAMAWESAVNVAPLGRWPSWGKKLRVSKGRTYKGGGVVGGEGPPTVATGNMHVWA